MLCLLTIGVVAAVVLYFVWNNKQWKDCNPDYTGKTVFISGGSSGLGEEMAKQMVKLGAAKVIIAARRVSELKRV